MRVLGIVTTACGCSSVAELQLPKLIARVRFSSPAPPIGPAAPMAATDGSDQGQATRASAQHRQRYPGALWRVPALRQVRGEQGDHVAQGDPPDCSGADVVQMMLDVVQVVEGKCFHGEGGTVAPASGP